MTSGRAVGRFDASVGSLSPIRRLVHDAVTGWGCEELVDDAMLCVSELASNAILHTRLPFDVEVVQCEQGVRIEVTDRRPQELPAVVPATGLASDITSQGTTGRGLQIVASLADRWGVVADADHKTVWVELRPGAADGRSDPIMVRECAPRTAENDVTLRLLSMPVRAAVASGMHLDGVVRELQLGAGDPGDETLDQLYALLDESAPVRLEGRRKALQAASRDEPRFNLTIHTSRRTLDAVARLNELMGELAGTRRSVAAPTGVRAFRAWLRDEAQRQVRGVPPQPCPLT